MTFDLEQALSELGMMATKAPQTQKDIAQIAATTQRLEDPAFQRQVAEIQSGIQQFAHAQLLLQTMSVIAMAGLFTVALLTYLDERKRHRAPRSHRGFGSA